MLPPTAPSSSPAEPIKPTPLPAADRTNPWPVIPPQLVVPTSPGRIAPDGPPMNIVPGEAICGRQSNGAADDGQKAAC